MSEEKEKWNPGLNWGHENPNNWEAYLHDIKDHCPVCAEIGFQIIEEWKKSVTEFTALLMQDKDLSTPMSIVDRIKDPKLREAITSHIKSILGAVESEIY